MKKKSELRMSMVAVPAIIICGLLVAGSSARVGRGVGRDDEHTKACSNNTLQGDYGFAVQGEILGPGIQFRGVVMQRYDGRGNITQVDHIVQNGMPSNGVETGHRNLQCQSKLHWISRAHSPR